jgi:Na+:H+ antiporter, NhaA family
VLRRSQRDRKALVGPPCVIEGLGVTLPISAPASPLKASLLQPLERFFRIEASSGILLLAAAVAAVLWANSPWAPYYDALWHLPLSIGAGDAVFTRSLHFWINDGLMAVFFLVVGLEIRREIHEGALATFRAAVLPLAAALGGVLVPALIYLAFNSSGGQPDGWAVPTVTDIAFAIGALTLLGNRVPSGLRVLLLAIAIIDDIVAILVIALFYSDGIVLHGLFITAGGIASVKLFQSLGVHNAIAYLAPGAVIWAGFLTAGIHPALSGVLLGILTPVITTENQDGLLARATRALDDLRDRLRRDEKDVHELSFPVQELKFAQREVLPPVVRVQLILHPWVAFGIMPLFALANAGVAISGISIESELTAPLLLGIGVGLVAGKPIGIFLVTAFLVKIRWCTLPPGVNLKGVLVIGCLAGIGFTMAIFLCALAFSDASTLATGKLSVLLASSLAAIAGLLMGRRLLHVAP